MRSLLEVLILDFHRRLKEDALPKPIPREVELAFLPSKVDSVIGVRRGGKTWLLFQKIRNLLKEGVSPSSLLYINFEDERLLPISSEAMDLLLRTYYSLYPEMTKERKYFFLDEVQNVEGWEKFVRRIVDQENVHVVVTGSSSKLLSREIATALRGRAIATEVYPLSFREFLKFHGVEPPDPQRLDSSTRAVLSHEFRKYMEIGGFPEVQSFSDFDQLRTLQEYTRSIVLRDVAERHGLKNIAVLRTMVRYMLNNPATLFSANKLFNYIRSLGMKVDKNFVYEAVEHLSDAYFLFLVCKHTWSEKAKQVSPSKLYLIDQGLIIANLKKPEPDWGRILENVVFLHLKREFLEVEYYRSEHSEVDFIVFDPISRRKAAVQVSLSLEDNRTFRRELKGLEEVLMKEIAPRALLLTGEDREEEHRIGKETIAVLPVWKFLLSPSHFLFYA